MAFLVFLQEISINIMNAINEPLFWLFATNKTNILQRRVKSSMLSDVIRILKLTKVSVCYM